MLWPGPFRRFGMRPDQAIKTAKRIVIKVGSVLLTDESTGDLRRDWLKSLVADVNNLIKDGKEVVIVSSGSIALGRKALNISKDQAPSSIPLDMKQAAAATGQIKLLQAYHKAFEEHGIDVGQVLLTPHDTENRRSHLNARATINKLLEQGIVPVINENDTVSTAEIRFGDNDRLAARVAQMIAADLLIQLSTTDGLYTSNPDQNEGAEHIPLIEELNDDYYAMAGDARIGLSVGGMKSKLEAARIATSAGTAMIISSGVSPHPLQALEHGARSTLFKAQEQSASSRKKWIMAHVDPKGSVEIDRGAEKALKEGKSLLPAGVTGIEGVFSRGDAVIVITASGKPIAIGLIAYNHEDARQIMGRQSSEIENILGYTGRDVLIHRDDLVLQD